MGTLGRRSLLYGCSALVLAALGYGGFIHEAYPDLGTLLGSAELQLQLAGGMPAHDKQGRPLAARQALIDGAKKNLEIAERIQPDLAAAWELRAYLLLLEGHHEQAAMTYAAASNKQDCSPELKRILELNEARTWLSAGNHERAKAVLNRVSVAAAGEAGEILEAIGDSAAAARAYERTEPTPRLLYLRARLKLKAGAVDEAGDLLERAVASGTPELASLLKQDAQIWSAAANPRLDKLVERAAAPPGR
jgi:tetratricopeptide (TPR) repeat protein